MNLVIDIGNTQYKLSVFNENRMVNHRYLDDINHGFINELCDEYNITKCIFSDTRGVDFKSLRKIIPEHISMLALTHETNLPIHINYATPETLGKDRIAAAVGASKIYPKSNVLVIDIGTALTIDFISEKNVFEGGIISPGQELRFKALHYFTGKLPLEQAKENTELSGNSTSTAIQYGVQNSIIFEINEYISRYSKQYADLKIIITGGDAYLFDKKIKYAIFAEPFLVPIGLNTIINYND